AEVESGLIESAVRQGKTVGLCRRAYPGYGQNVALEKTTVQWLSDTARISTEEANTIICAMGIPVAKKLLWNAGTERTLLSISAVLVQKPDVLAYETSGCDV